MRRMSVTTSGARRGSRGPARRDFRRQNNRNPSRCHRRTVSGLSTSRAWRHWERKLARSTIRPRSWVRRTGRLRAREATMSCWRRSTFSATSSARERVRSAMKPLATPEGRHASPSALIARAATPASLARSREPDEQGTARSEPIRRRSSRLVPTRILSDRAAEEGSSQDSHRPHGAFRRSASHIRSLLEEAAAKGLLRTTASDLRGVLHRSFEPSPLRSTCPVADWSVSRSPRNRLLRGTRSRG